MQGLAISVAVSELVAAYLVWKVWKSDDYMFFKIIYSVLAFFPFVGPFIVFWSANFPSRQDAVFQDRERYRTDVLDRWRHVFDERNPHARFRPWQELREKRDTDSKPPTG
jgi:hypothetical protein